ncbi:hypothetical protein QR692_09985 [Lactococcus petauri]|uniref:hypothetical protein n=1 Tax=Lactococcus petauri TaxID=1940789 RepID=UPI0021F93B6F|nr:hypothetical protein [Lactococcus petauri]USI65312.1 hypothetical protein LMK05_10870 [Lactococcus petauri]WJE12468.1 hypothetical protein QR692_09985 [Lactococcus petauri]
MEIPDFILDNAKRVSNFDSLMQARDSERDSQILWGTVKTVYEQVAWKTSNANYQEAMVEVETDEGLIIYVPQRQMSYHMSEPRALVFMTDEKVPLVVHRHVRIEGTMQDWEEVNYRPNSEYVILGSIKQAEWQLGKEFEVRFHRENSPLKKELKGKVVDIYEPWGARGHRFITVDYEGVSITIPAEAYSYVHLSRVQKLEDTVRLGQEIYFKIFDLEERPVTAQMRERHIKMGDNDTYWSIVGEALYNKESPHEAIARLKQSGASSTLAYLLKETVDGYFVELVDAPGISLRMKSGGHGKYKPTHQMVERHERVAVGLSDLRETYTTTEDGFERYDGFVRYVPKR